jgi:hypothetical protein
MMRIAAPTEIKEIAWEGSLEPPETAKSIGDTPRPVVTIGKPEIWDTADALKNEVNQVWTPPLTAASFWLVRLACTLREPPGLPHITEVEQSLYLRPKNRLAKPDSTYAYSLYPDRLTAENKTDFTLSLGPALKFGEAELKVGELGAAIEYRRVYPVIQSYGAGSPTPSWFFKPHAAHPLEGDQFVYAVLAAQNGAEGIRVSLDLKVTIESELGPIRFAPPEKARANLSFTVPTT